MGLHVVGLDTNYYVQRYGDSILLRRADNAAGYSYKCLYLTISQNPHKQCNVTAASNYHRNNSEGSCFGKNQSNYCRSINHSKIIFICPLFKRGKHLIYIFNITLIILPCLIMNNFHVTENAILSGVCLNSDNTVLIRHYYF